MKNKNETNLMHYKKELKDIFYSVFKLDSINLVTKIRDECNADLYLTDGQTLIEDLFDWMSQEFHEGILDDVEKKYLSTVIKPFRKNINYIRKNKCKYSNELFISIVFFNGDYMHFPFLDNDEMYKGMEVNKNYSLKELGL